MNETLYFIKETKNMYVFGNDKIQSFYLPKEEFNYDAPDEIEITIRW